MQVCVVGLGKIGLPLAAQYALRGLTTSGCDIAPQVVEAINAGYSPINGEPGLAEAVALGVATRRLKATTDTTLAVSQSDVVVVIVPLLIDENRQPSFNSIDAATLAIARGLLGPRVIVLAKCWKM
jgi:UDP-N-acetyl-D-mannosaminuronate dehydrogenase